MLNTLASVPVVVEGPIEVRKRDGSTLQPFNIEKIEKAIFNAWEDAEGAENAKLASQEGLLRSIANLAAGSLPRTALVEEIQDAVEVALMRHRKYKVAKSYILYRQKRSEFRQVRKHPDPVAVSDYIHAAKYARYLPELLRREVYEETVDRVEAMHQKRFAHIPGFSEEIKWAFDLVRQKKVLPSMRSMQFGGRAVEVNNNRIYNCSFSFVDRTRVFAEAIYLLLCGCGVGYSVQFDHVDKLPPLAYIDKKQVKHHVIDDSIEGWADALDALVNSYVDGYLLELSYHQIRAAGTPLKTSGGRAPGHLKLKESLDRIRDVLNGAQGRQLRPIECHRIMCHAADAVLSGGIRRSAMIALFSLSDREMMDAKTGNWGDRDPWFQNANNSVMLKRSEIKEPEFKRIFQMTKQWGEPGFFFCEDFDHGTNPCAEIGLNPKLVINDETRQLIAKKMGESFAASLPEGATMSGWAFCNLCEGNAAKMTSLEDFIAVGKAATLIGTMQASYTSMPYLGFISEVIAEREALLGIGMTGMLDSPQIACNPEYQTLVAGMIKQWNAEYAAKIGIRPAARTTCVKPSGTTSLELGSVGSGHHPHHARRYIRRVTADELEIVFQAFKARNPHMCVRKPDGKWVIEFPVEAPAGAIVREDVNAIPFLEMVRSTQQNWVLNGTARPESSPGLNHNVSNTVTVKPDEWESVADYIYKNRQYFTGVSLLSETGDKDFPFAPNEAVTTEADEARWNALIGNYEPVDYTAIFEGEDGTNLTGEAACANGACDVVFPR